MSIDSIIDFLDPINTHELSEDEGFHNTQMGKHIAAYENSFPDIEHADIVLVGCNETRGSGIHTKNNNSPNEIRKAFYKLYRWHGEVTIADVGNVKSGATMPDSYAALRTVVLELLHHGKRVVILGGSHDVSRAQYNAYAAMKQLIDITCIDARIDMDSDSILPSDKFWIDLLTHEPNYARHYNHIGFQSYMVHPTMLEMIDKLRFDCYRLGNVKEKIEESEPVLRNSNMLSFDIAAIQHCHAPANKLSPNGFTGEEACTLMQYAGMSEAMNSVGIYGYDVLQDVHTLTAKQIAHMLWYYVDGVQKAKFESPITEANNFLEFKLAFAEMESTFLQSRKTGRWWMQLPDGEYIACSYNDYLLAAHNDIPERWLRAVERM